MEDHDNGTDLESIDNSEKSYSHDLESYWIQECAYVNMDASISLPSDPKSIEEALAGPHKEDRGGPRSEGAVRYGPCARPWMGPRRWEHLPKDRRAFRCAGSRPARRAYAGSRKPSGHRPA